MEPQDSDLLCPRPVRAEALRAKSKMRVGILGVEVRAKHVST